MTVYGVSRFCHRLTIDAAHRALARDDLAAALEGFDLTHDERRAIAEGDVAQLFGNGVHPFLLVRLHQHGVAGLTEATYSERIRRLREDEQPEARP